MLGSLLDLDHLRWSLRGLVLRLIAAVLALVGCIFLLMALWWVLAFYLAAPWPAVVMGGGFLLLAMLFLLVAAVRRPPPRSAPAPLSLAGTAASTVFDIVRRYPMATLLAAVAAGIATEWVSPRRRR